MNIFIDTNIFLSFYHLSNDDLEEIHKLAVLIKQGEVALWLPEQVKDEFNRNRENKISDAVRKLKEQKVKLQFPQVCKDYDEYIQIKELQREYLKKLSSLIANVNRDVEGKTLQADEKIEELFEIAEKIELTPELIEKARVRVELGNPPGKNGSLGDAVNWECLIENVPKNEDLFLIADDKDYYSVLDEYKLKDVLDDEWQTNKGSKIFFYRRLSQFFKDEYPDIKLASELEKELIIRELSESRSFTSTHSVIEKLQQYTEFNKSQANDIAQIVKSNPQVRWILSDSDVHEFCVGFLKDHEELLDDEIRNYLSEKVGKIEADD